MEMQEFKLAGVIQGKVRDLTVKVPVEKSGVRTDKFCPQDLLTGGLSFVTAINGEIVSEFVTDCANQVKAMEFVGSKESLLDVHIAGLMDVVMNHLARCGRIIFGDLLIYMASASCSKQPVSRKQKSVKYILGGLVQSLNSSPTSSSILPTYLASREVISTSFFSTNLRKYKSDLPFSNPGIINRTSILRHY